ncbi:MAG: sulfotransferase domain-containing protein [Thermoanaerobaculia bacterium]
MFARPGNSVPVFVFGKQRSGTTMLMEVFHARADTEVYNERRHSEVYVDFRVRGFEVVEEVIRRSKAPFVCFKPLADSHLIREFASRFPGARVIWAYRNYVDAARSSLRKFGHATRAIRLVCTGQAGGGWFAEALSADTVRTLRAVYRPTLSALDFSCLVWWARNRLVFELELDRLPNTYISKYEDIVNDRQGALAALFTFVGMPHDEKAVRRVSGPRPGARELPVLDVEVRRLCDELLVGLDALRGYRAGESVPKSASLP